MCVHAIKCGLSNKLFDNYCHFSCTKDLWDELNGRYGFDDEGAKKFATAKFMSFQMVEEKSVSSQIEDFQKLVSDLAKEGNVLLERFVAHDLVFKLPDSWKEYKHRYSHHRTYLNLQQTIVDIQIGETNRMSEKVSRVKEFTSKANVVEEDPLDLHNIIRNMILRKNENFIIKMAQIFKSKRKRVIVLFVAR